MDMLLKHGHIIDPVTHTDTVADVLIINGTIEKIGDNLTADKSIPTREMRGNIIAPGFIDMHVHLREPGFEHKETVESGCLSAAAGGFTAVCCMPNTRPAIDDASVVRNIIEKGKQSLMGIVDVYPIAAITVGREGKRLAPMMELAEAGAIAFTDDGLPVQDAEIMRRALEYAGMVGKPVIQHAEDTSLTKGGVMNEGIVSTSLGLQPMPSIAEEVMIVRDVKLVEYLHAQYHVAHLSTAGAVDILRDAKRRKFPVTCEVTPHHFSLTDEAVRTFDTNTKMNPPLRTQDDIESIKEALQDGTIDVIATDHAPHTYDEKQVEFIYAPFGIVGLETAIGLSFTKLILTKVISLVQLIEKFSTNPRSILHLPAIRIAEGEEANITLIDPEIEWKVDVRQFKSKSRNSPFDTWKLQGKAIGIINNNSACF